MLNINTRSLAPPRKEEGKGNFLMISDILKLILFLSYFQKYILSLIICQKQIFYKKNKPNFTENVRILSFQIYVNLKWKCKCDDKLVKIDFSIELRMTQQNIRILKYKNIFCFVLVTNIRKPKYKNIFF